MQKLFTALILGAGLTLGAQAFAGDHLASATGARNDNPADVSGNPVGGNPSGVSGSASGPGSVPGEGDPNHGGQQDTPSVSDGGGQARSADRRN